MTQITLTKEQIEKVLKENSAKTPEPTTYSIIGASRILGIRKNKIYNLINSGDIQKIMIGKSPRIHIEEIEKFKLK